MFLSFGKFLELNLKGRVGADGRLGICLPRNQLACLMTVWPGWDGERDPKADEMLL